MNVTTTVLAIFAALMTGGSIWGFLATFINRKADRKEQDARTQTTLEEASRQFRDEIRQENVSLKKDMAKVKEAIISLTDVLDDLLPKMIECLDLDEKLRLRDAVNAAKIAT